MKQNKYRFTSLSLGAALLAGLFVLPAIAQPDDVLGNPQDDEPETRIVQDTLHTAAVHLNGDEDLELTFANATGFGSPVVVLAYNREGTEIYRRVIRVHDEASRRLVVFPAARRNKALGLVRLEVIYTTTCEMNPENTPSFALRGVRRNDGVFQDVLFSKVHNPCVLGIKLGPPDGRNEDTEDGAERPGPGFVQPVFRSR